MVEFVIAEVKSGKKAGLNGIWFKQDEGGKYDKRVRYLLRWLGPLAKEDEIARAAKNLREKHRARVGNTFSA